MKNKLVRLFVCLILIIFIIPTTQSVEKIKPYNQQIFTSGPTSPIIAGPESGVKKVEYNFSFVSTDPSILDLFYYIEWGDGNVEEWIGPYSSGLKINLSHTWDENGTFTIRAKSKNTNETESDWSENHNITIIHGVELEIGEIVGGLLGVTSIINNTGINNATNVVASIKIDGGIIFIGKEISENLGTIEPGNYSGIYDIPLLGFGLINIIISAKSDEVKEIKKTASGFLLLFYIKMY